MPTKCNVLGLISILSQVTFAQSPSTAGLSGRVFSETGRTLRATVTLSFADPRGYPAPPRRIATGATGAFAFTKLPAARYVLCAQVADADVPPADAPLVDTCVWPTTQPPIVLATGQQLAGINLTVPKAALLKIHVDDPDHVLPAAALGKGPAPLDPQLQLTLKGPDGLHRHARFQSADSNGRNYQIAVPLNTALNLTATRSVATVHDPNGKQLAATDQVGVQAATPAALAPVNITLHRKSP